MKRNKPAPAPGSSEKRPSAPDWFDQEPRAGATILKLGRRLLQRGLATWRLWLVAALLVGAGWALFKVRRGNDFEGTIVLRVSEGAQQKAASPGVVNPGVMLGRGKLRTYINEVALSKPSLIKLMSGHPKSFPRVESDPSFAVQSFRENMTVEISENDFVEERRSDDPPRSARVIINFKAGDPELAWQIAQELGALAIGSTIEGQRSQLTADLEGARTEASRAAEAVTALEGRTGPNMQLDIARQRLLNAQQKVEDTSIALRALGQEQVLKFEVVDRGRVQPRPNPVRVGVKAFVITSLLAALAAWLLAGAFDPRVLDEVDVAGAGMPVLGRLPRLTGPPPDPAAEPEQPPERRSIPGGAADPRV